MSEEDAWKTHSLVTRPYPRKMSENPVQNPPNRDNSPMISRNKAENLTRLPNAFARKNPGNASLSIA